MATKTKKTATTAAKKTAEKAPETAIERVEELTSKAQDQYLSTLEQGQDAALRGYSAVIDAVGRIEFPAVPGLDSITPDFASMEIPTESLTKMSDSMFDFANKVVENQRAFAKKVLAATSK